MVYVWSRGLAAKSIIECRVADSVSLVLFHRTDIGEFLRNEDALPMKSIFFCYWKNENIVDCFLDFIQRQKWQLLKFRIYHGITIFHHFLRKSFFHSNRNRFFFNISLQPNLDTRRKQLDAWCSLVLDYCRLKKVCTFDVNDASKFAPFSNAKINRM